MRTIRAKLKSAPGGAALLRLNRRLRRRFLRVQDSAAFWESTYAKGGTSGPGSFGQSARYKAAFLNRLVRAHDVQSVIEFGCGDGNQLALVDYRRYVGLDVAPTALQACIRRFAGDTTKSFFLYRPDCFADRTGVFKADLGVSLEVIFHLLEDDVYETYMRHLFGCAERLVVIYASDSDVPGEDPSVRHRPILRWVSINADDWELIERTETEWTSDSFSDFFVFARR